MKILENYPLKNLNTFGINAFAKYFVDVKSEEELQTIITGEEFSKVSKFILGGGSNILLSSNFNGIVIRNSLPGIEIIKENEKSVYVKAGAGEVWHNLVLYCVGKNFGGIENLSLIPGTVGAAPMQNIGAYGQEIKDVFVELSGNSIPGGETKVYNNKECRFGYRDSIFKHELKNKFVITSVTIKLNKNPELNLAYGTISKEIEKSGLRNISIKDVSEVVCKIRKSKLPDPSKIGNAGSFFKNPQIDETEFSNLKKDFPGIVGYEIGNGKVKLAAGWLIENCGWKGKKIGNTGTHEKQALVLVNYGNATGKEILNLAQEIKNSVKSKFNVVLEEEINII